MIDLFAIKEDNNGLNNGKSLSIKNSNKVKVGFDTN